MDTERTDLRVRSDYFDRDSGDSPHSASSAFQRLDPYLVTLIFLALTIALTWPLAKGLTRDIPGDLGDPLFNAWVLAWDATHFGRGWLQANIFYPHPLTLAYSELLVPQALQILAGLRRDRQSISLLQPRVSFHVRSVGTRHVPVLPRADRQPDGGIRRRPRLRIRAVPRDVDTPHPGDVGAVAAVRPVRS